MIVVKNMYRLYKNEPTEEAYALDAKKELREILRASYTTKQVNEILKTMVITK